ncbi:MAG TPA: cation:proton antiporter regulatory subunit [Euzebya sp.]|nr:cation:proton antiporter regulatory subunit [Euzebya sp.]
MADIEETVLPGVGVRHDFMARSGHRIGVISHRSGSKELLVYDEHDPDACSESVRLESAEAQVVGQLLGAATVTERLLDLQQTVEGLTIDWLAVAPSWHAAGRTIGQSELRRRTGVTIIAVVRGNETLPSPGPGFVLHAGDTAVVVGTVDGIRDAVQRLQNG